MPRVRPVLITAVALAGVAALLAPAVPALTRYGALPRSPEGPVNVLLAGVTPRYDDHAAVWPWPAKPEDFSYITDTIVLVQLRPGGQVQLLSVPRDTWLNVPGWGYGKINGANSHGGPTMMVNAVQSVTGLHVDAYGLLSLNALRDLTEAAGGVSLTVPEDMKYDDTAGKLHIDLKAGPQHLNGQQAEGFLRFRHDALGDIGRVARQQQFLAALAARLRSPLNIWRLPAVVGALDRNTRSNLSRQDFAHVLGVVASGPKISALTLPGSFGAGGTWVPDRAAIRALVQQKFSDPADPRGLSVALINVNAPPGTARKYRAQLQAAGYQDVSTDTQQRTLARTVVSGPVVAARKLIADLGFGELASTAAADTGLTVQLGADAR